MRTTALLARTLLTATSCVAASTLNDQAEVTVEAIGDGDTDEATE